MTLTRTLASASLAGLLVLAACGSDKKSADTVAPKQTVTVSSGNFSESQLLAQIYGKAMENAGIRVAYKDPIGPRELYFAAISKNEVQLIPEYTNSLLSFVLKQADPNATSDAKTIDDQVTALKAKLAPALTVGAPSTAEDKDVIVCTKAVADKYKLTNLTELGAASANITIGAPPEFETRSPFGLKGFTDLLGAKFKSYVPLPIEQVADSLKSGAIDCGNLFSTTPAISSNGFVALEDDKTLVPHEAVLPLLTTAAATPEVLQAVDAVSSQLTTDALTAMLVKTDVEKQSFDTVAKAFLNGEFTTTATTVAATGATTATTSAGATATTTGAPTTTTY
jgi:osmoprotectant transport system substrate-binding protein